MVATLYIWASNTYEVSVHILFVGSHILFLGVHVSYVVAHVLYMGGHTLFVDVHYTSYGRPNMGQTSRTFGLPSISDGRPLNFVDSHEYGWKVTHLSGRP